MESAKESFEPFGTAVLDSGVLTAWDLAKTVATKMRAAYRRSDPLAGEVELEALARSLEKAHPAQRAACVRDSSRRSPSVGSVCHRRLSGRCVRRTRSSR